MNKIPLVIILGPTAVGKTDISIKIAKQMNGEIISADSMQIYKYMDIGTAKPSLDERQGIPHHLLDIVYPDEYFNVSLYKKVAAKTIQEVYSRGKLPIVAGGTGLYINSLIYPLDFTEAHEDKQFREELIMGMKKQGKEWLYNELKLVDPQSAKRLHPNDVRRIIRALEVHHITGKPMSEYYKHRFKKDDQYNLALIGLTMDRKSLYDRINKRVDLMLEKGLVGEVKWLMEKGYGKHLNSMQGLGYKEIVEYLIGQRTLEESIYILKRDTRHFAKRQLTWFRRITNVTWLEVDRYDNKDILVKNICDAILEKIREHL